VRARTRLHLPFALLSDDHLQFIHAMRLPTFQVNGWTHTKRLTLVLHHQRIEKVFYPVFPPDKQGDQVVTSLRDKRNGLI
jgi:peroxiredoxin